MLVGENREDADMTGQHIFYIVVALGALLALAVAGAPLLAVAALPVLAAVAIHAVAPKPEPVKVRARR